MKMVWSMNRLSTVDHVGSLVRAKLTCDGSSDGTARRAAAARRSRKGTTGEQRRG